jgi:hypothetical protein
VAQRLRILSIDSSITEAQYARNYFDRPHDFAADGCIVTWAHGRSSVYYRGGELEPQIGSQQYITGTGPKGADLGNWEVLMPLVQLVLILIVVGVLLGLINRYIPMAGSIKSILNGVVVIAVVLWLLNVFGLFSSLSAIHVGNLSWLSANGA